MEDKNAFKKLLKKAKETKTPIQKEKSGVIKPVEKSYYLSMEEEKLIQLKKMAAEQRTSIKALINNAIDEMYF